MTTFRKLGLQVVGLLFIVALSAPAHAANLIVNGDFSVFVPSNGAGGGWTSSLIDGAGGWRGTGGNPDGTFLLNHFGGGGLADPTIVQLVSGLTAGATYRLTGNYANIYNCCGSLGPNTFAVDVDGANLDKLDFPGAGVWGSFSFDIVASDTDFLIAFRAEIDGDDTDYKIDNISLEQIGAVPVPEPGTLVLIVAGIAMLVSKRFQP